MYKSSLTALAIITSVFSVKADTGINSIKAKGMGDTSITHEYGRMGAMSNPANAAIYDIRENTYALYLTGAGVDSELDDSNTYAGFSPNQFMAGGVNLSYRSGFSVGIYLAESDYQTIAQLRDSQETQFVTMGSDTYYVSYTWQGSTWQHTLGASLGGYGITVPSSVNETKWIEDYITVFGLKSSRDFKWHVNDQTLMAHIALAATHSGQAHLQANGIFEAITILPASTTVGAYLEISHFNSSLPWQLGVATEYELVSEPHDDHTSPLVSVDHRIRLGAEFSIFSLFDGDASLSLRGGVHQIVLVDEQMHSEPSVGLSYYTGNWAFDLAATEQKYPVPANVLHAGISLQF